MSVSTTSTIRSLCPKCNNNVPTLRLNEGEVLVKCDCELYNSYPLEEYLRIIEQKENVLCTYHRLCTLHKEPYSTHCGKCRISLCDKGIDKHNAKTCYERHYKKKKKNTTRLKVFLTHCFK